jgi:hypothetical protein
MGWTFSNAPTSPSRVRCASPFETLIFDKTSYFCDMHLQVDIKFEQILKLVKTLPKGQLKQLKAEIEKKVKNGKSVDLETLLLNGPTATKKQIETIVKNRKAINQWRTK